MAFNAGAVVATADLNTKKWDTSLKGMQGGLGKFGKFAAGAFAAVGGAAAAGLAKSIGSANQFQKAISNVATVIDTGKISTAQLTSELLKMDPALGSTTDLTKGLYQAFSAGAPTAQAALQITADSAVFAKAALTDTNTAVDVLTTAVNAYGGETVSSTQAADVFFTTIKQGKITGEQLAATIGQSIPLFASTGIELEELASGMAAMTKQGVSANEATTQLNAIVNSFLKPSKAMAERLAALGVESGSAFLEAEGLSGALAFLEDQTGGNAAELAELLPNIRAMRGAMALTGTGGEEFTRVLEEMEGASGAAAEAFGKQEKTFDTLQNQLGQLEIVVGNIGKAFADEMAGSLTDIVADMEEFVKSSSGMDMLANAAGFAAGGFELIKQFLTPLVESLGPVFEGILSTTTDALDNVTGASAEGAGSFNLFSGIAQFLASSLRVVGKVVEFVIQGFGNLMTAGKLTFNAIAAFIKTPFKKQNWEGAFREAGEGFVKIGNDASESIADIFSTIGSEMSTFADRVKEQSVTMEVAVMRSQENAENLVRGAYARMTEAAEESDQEIGRSYAERLEAQIEKNRQAQARQLEIERKAAEERKKIAREEAQKRIAISQKVIDTMSGAYSSISTIVSGAYQLQVNEAQTAYDREKAILDQKKEDRIISEDEYQAAVLNLNNTTGKKLDDVKRRQFEAEKGTAIADVWLRAAQGVASAVAAAAPMLLAGIPIAAGISAGILAAAGVQTGVIASKKYVPAFQRGGRMPYTGLARVNERGGELMMLPGGTTIIPNDISRNMTQPQSITININYPSVRHDDDIREVADTVSRVLARKMRMTTA